MPLEDQCLGDPSDWKAATELVRLIPRPFINYNAPVALPPPGASMRDKINQGR